MLRPPPLQGVPPLHTSRAGTGCQERCSHSSANDSDGPRSCPFQVKSEGSCGALQCRPGEPHTGRTRWGRLPSPRAPSTASPSRHRLDHWAGATDTPRSPRSPHCSASKPSSLCLVPWRLWEAISKTTDCLNKRLKTRYSTLLANGPKAASFPSTKLLPDTCDI